MNLDFIVRQFLEKNNDTYNEKTCRIRIIRKKIETYYAMLFENYEKMDLPQEFVIFLREYYISPDPFVILPSYFGFRMQIIRNKIRELNEKKYTILKLFKRVIPANCEEKKIYFVYINIKSNIFFDKMNKHFIIVKEKFSLFAAKLDIDNELDPQYVPDTFQNILRMFYEFN